MGVCVCVCVCVYIYIIWLYVIILNKEVLCPSEVRTLLTYSKSSENNLQDFYFG